MELGAFVGLRLPVGLCMAVIAIVLARISLDFQGVLQVELKDFWGGVVVGLLAQSTTGPVAEALGRIIGTARQAQSDSEDESRSRHPRLRPRSHSNPIVMRDMAEPSLQDGRVELVDQLQTKTARSIRSAPESGTLSGARCWPGCRLVSAEETGTDPGEESSRNLERHTLTAGHGSTAPSFTHRPRSTWSTMTMAHCPPVPPPQKEKQRMKRSAFVALICIAVTAIAAGLATTGAPVRQPELPRTLGLLCTPHILWCEGMKTEFQRIYPKTTVEFVRLSSGEALTRLRNERANHAVRHLVGWADRLVYRRQTGRSARSLRLAHLLNLIDPKLMKDPDNYWAGIYIGSLGFASNKHFLEKHKLQPPESWDDLLNPAFKNQLVMAHPASSGTAYTALITVLQLKGEDGWLNYWKQFHAMFGSIPNPAQRPRSTSGKGRRRSVSSSPTTSSRSWRRVCR